jgi:hypothetical protein
MTIINYNRKTFIVQAIVVIAVHVYPSLIFGRKARNQPLQRVPVWGIAYNFNKACVDITNTLAYNAAVLFNGTARFKKCKQLFVY